MKMVNLKRVSQAVLVCWFLFTISINLAMIHFATNSLLDFGSFIAAGMNLNHGGDPYSSESPLIFEIHFPTVEAGGKLPNLNPPISLVFFQRLETTNHLLLANTWRLTSLVIYLLAVYLLTRENRVSATRLLWIFSLSGFWHTLELGQIYTALLLLIVMVWIAARSNNFTVAGILLGCFIAIKPNFILWVLLLIVAKQWKMSIAALITLLILSLIPICLYGPSVYLQWLEATRVEIPILAMPGNSSFVGLTSRLGYPQIGAFLAAFLVAFTAFVIWADRRRTSKPDINMINGLGIVLSLLASPISWVGYTIFLLPIFLSQAKWSKVLRLAAIILTFPFILSLQLYVISHLNYVIWGWLFGLAIALVLVTLLLQSKFIQVLLQRKIVLSYGS
jgi:hypothetical protein